MSCEADKLAIKIGGCFKQNNDPDENIKQECLDPCNRPSEPTTYCPFGGTPRFEQWDYIRGLTWVSPRCGEEAPLFICGDNYEKYRVGMRVSVLGVGSYEVTAVLPDRLIVRNTGNAPDGISFQNNGTLILTIGNHDGHWNDANCDDLPLADSGDIYLGNVHPTPEDCCAQGVARCKCKGILEQGIGFLQSVVEGTRRVYRWVQDVMDRALCNETMPNAERADAIIGKRDNSCGVKLRPSGGCQYLKTMDGGVGFGELDICCVPEGVFSLTESRLLQCRNGQTTLTDILPALETYLNAKDILSPSDYPDGGDAQVTDRYVVSRNGVGALVNSPMELIAAVEFSRMIDFPTFNVIKSKNFLNFNTTSGGWFAYFNTGTTTENKIIALASGFIEYNIQGSDNPSNKVEPIIISYAQTIGTQTSVQIKNTIPSGVTHVGQVQGTIALFRI